MDIVGFPETLRFSRKLQNFVIKIWTFRKILFPGRRRNPWRQAGPSLTTPLYRIHRSQRLHPERRLFKPSGFRWRWFRVIAKCENVRISEVEADSDGNFQKSAFHNCRGDPEGGFAFWTDCRRTAGLSAGQTNGKSWIVDFQVKWWLNSCSP